MPDPLCGWLILALVACCVGILFASPAERRPEGYLGLKNIRQHRMRQQGFKRRASR